MGRSRFKILEQAPPHFLTCTIVDWLPLFFDPAIVAIISSSLKFLQDRDRIALYGYVIMENHIHLIASSPDLSNAMKSFKSFTAKEIIEYLKDKGGTVILRKLEFHKAAHKRESSFQLWQEGFHPVPIAGEKMLIEKLQYIHNNPLRRGYVDDPVHWRYSSARNYAEMSDVLIELKGVELTE